MPLCAVEESVPAGLLFAGVSVAFVWWSFVPEYLSSATLMLRSRPPHIVYAGRDGGVSASLGTQLQMITMQSVLSVAQEKLGTVDEIKTLQDPVNWIKGRLTVTRVRGTDLYTVGFNTRTPSKPRRSCRSGQRLSDFQPKF